MKTEPIPVLQEFKPYSFTVHVLTQAEHEAFREIVKADCRIPDMLVQDGSTRDGISVRNVLQSLAGVVLGTSI